ncbi:right-handed parallel beta-helix repeat-containing protein [uncultured Duncaniella sp.]|uniref:right-handed parallel beta-helix repeat-containing protein n=1 Tax=uncultured Duncaniella sp. TaxID=2768039 RepID=UPI0025DA6A97|nr:right-handed parallel beta-helix repeat-containing protein [uncultured Duncaniella sp.]
MRFVALLVTLVLSTGIISYSGNIYVSASGGSDRANGSREHPLQTVGEALKRAREWRRLKAPEAADDIRIILDGGVYRQTSPLFLRPEDSGNQKSATVICAPEGTRAVISGGVEVTDWTRGCDDSRVAPHLRDKIWVAEAPLNGTRIVETRQLYVDGEKAQRASQFAPGVMERMVDFNTEDRTITVPTPEFDLSKARQLEMFVHQRWAIAILRVKDMKDDGNGNTVVSFHDPESRLEFEHPWPQPVIGGERGNSSFFFANALELLDEPGEWYQDYPSGRIYYYPSTDEDMNNREVVVPLLETILAVEGSRERPVCDIRFENIDFEHASWLRPSHEGHVTLQGGFRLLDAYKLHIPGLPEKAELENQAWIARPEAAITVRHASGIDFIGCGFRHLGATGLDYVAAVSNSAVNGCTFEDIGGTALQMGTFPDGGFETHVPYVPAVAEDICRDIKVTANTIRNATNEDWGCVGIGAGYVRDVTIADNEVSHLNYSGICVGWGWTALESGMCNNRITGNHVHHFAAQLYDAGGIYTLSNQPGSVISGNRIENLIDAPYATNNRAFYIYFDEATDGYTVEGNHCPNPEFGYNRPGPKLIVGDNGPHISVK